jgi:hypothetical protein
MKKGKIMSEKDGDAGQKTGDDLSVPDVTAELPNQGGILWLEKQFFPNQASACQGEDAPIQGHDAYIKWLDSGRPKIKRATGR